MKNKIITAIILVIAIALITTSDILLKPKPEIGYEYFTQQPETWIEDNVATEDENDINIDVYKATRGKGVVDIKQENYFADGETIAFFYHGMYKGNLFQTAYVDEIFYNLSEGKTEEEQTELANKYTLMKISQKMNPNDNIIEGLVIGKIENNAYTFYIFVDEDWKKQLEFTNIIWGDNFLDKSKMHTKKFDFSRESNGIYMDKISEDANFFQLSPVKGGIIVGDVTLGIMESYWNYEDISATFIMVR